MQRTAKILVGGVVLAIVVAAGVAAAAVAWHDPGPGTFDVVATVDGEPIVYGEFQQSVDAERSRIFAYFRARYGAAATAKPSFWTTQIGGETPADKLKRAALTRSVAMKVEQIAARQHGLIADISYRASVDALEQVNKRRRALVDKGGVVYGPVAYDQKSYLDQRQQELHTHLMQKLRQALAVSDKEVADDYTRNKQRFYLGESRTVAAVSFTVPVTSPTPVAQTAGKLETAKAELAGLERRIAAGVTFDAIYAEVRRGGDGVLTASEQVHDYRTMRADTLTSPAMAQAVARLDEGAVTGVVQDDRSAGIYKCVDLRPLGYVPMAQVKSRILSTVRERKYDVLLERWRSKAKVKTFGRTLALAVVS